MRKYIKTHKIYNDFIYLKVFQKKEIFLRKPRSVNYKTFEAPLKTLDDTCEINKIFFKILTSSLFYTT